MGYSYNPDIPSLVLIILMLWAIKSFIRYIMHDLVYTSLYLQYFGHICMIYSYCYNWRMTILYFINENDYYYSLIMFVIDNEYHYKVGTNLSQFIRVLQEYSNESLISYSYHLSPHILPSYLSLTIYYQFIQ